MILVTTVEAFILSLVNRGALSSFDLNRQAGLSLGTLLPALKRLDASGLVRSSAPGARRRVTYSLTSTGEKALRNFVNNLLQGTRWTESEGALRAMFLAQWHGKPRLVQAIANSAASELESAADSKMVQVTRKDRSGYTEAADYRIARLGLEIARMRAEAKELRAIGQQELRRGQAKAQHKRRAAP